MPIYTEVQSAQGATTATLPDPAIAGNLLVVIQAHRNNPRTPNPPATGWTLKALSQFRTSNNDRSGVALWSKVADGGEQSVNTAFGTDTDLGGIIVEIASDVFQFYDSYIVSSGTSSPVDQAIAIPDPQTVASLVVAAAVSRGSDPLIAWSDDFNVPSAQREQMGLAWREDATLGSVVYQNTGGDETNALAAVWIGESWAISGTVAENSNPVEGARVVVVGSNEELEGFNLVGVATTNESGGWELQVPAETMAHAMVIHEDENGRWTAEGRPFIEDE